MVRNSEGCVWKVSVNTQLLLLSCSALHIFGSTVCFLFLNSFPFWVPPQNQCYSGYFGKAEMNESSPLWLLLHCFHLSPFVGLDLIPCLSFHSFRLSTFLKKLPFVGEVHRGWRKNKGKESQAVILTLYLRQVHWPSRCEAQVWWCVGNVTAQGNLLFSIRVTSSCRQWGLFIL